MCVGVAGVATLVYHCHANLSIVMLALLLVVIASVGARYADSIIFPKEWKAIVGKL